MSILFQHKFFLLVKIMLSTLPWMQWYLRIAYFWKIKNIILFNRIMSLLSQRNSSKLGQRCFIILIRISHSSVSCRLVIKLILILDTYLIKVSVFHFVFFWRSFILYVVKVIGFIIWRFWNIVISFYNLIPYIIIHPLIKCWAIITPGYVWVHAV